MPNSDEMKGRIKEAAGDLTDDKDLQREGKVDQASGKAKDTIDKASDKANGVSFVKATPQQRVTLLNVLDREQFDEGERRKAEGIKRTEAFLNEKTAPVSDVSPATAMTEQPPSHYFRMMKELALLGYFTSEIGCTQAQRYAETPGKYEPCIPYQPGQKAWAPHA